MAIGLVVIVVLGGFILWLIYTYNRFVAKQAKIDDIWDEVDTHLKLRHDLIPNLIEAAGGRLPEQTPLFDRIQQLRADLEKINDDTVAAEPLENELSNLMRRIRDASEANDTLMQDQRFITMLGELVSMEGRAGTACARHNDLVREFNQSIQRFPANLITGFLHFHPCEMRIFGVAGGTFGQA